MKNFKNKQMSSSELSFFCMQIALILKSGMLIHEGIEWMYNDLEHGKVKDMIGNIKKELSDKISIYNVMKKTKYFPSFLINMCQIGSLTGRLENVMVSLSEYYDREEYLKLKIRNALFYPTMLFAMMSAVVILLIVKIFPIFENMLKELGGDLSIGILAGKFTMFLVIAALLFIGFLIIAYKTNKGKVIIKNFLQNFIVTKSIIKKITAYRFSYSMSLLLSSGMSIEKSIDILSEIIDYEELKDIIKSCSNAMRAGDSFTDALSKVSIFSNMHVQMLSMGQRSGELDEVMQKLTTIYEQEANKAIDNVVSLVEPVLVGFLSTVVGIILISVMLPLINIMSSIG